MTNPDHQSYSIFRSNIANNSHLWSEQCDRQQTIGSSDNSHDANQNGHGRRHNLVHSSSLANFENGTSSNIIIPYCNRFRSYLHLLRFQFCMQALGRRHSLHDSFHPRPSSFKIGYPIRIRRPPHHASKSMPFSPYFLLPLNSQFDSHTQPHTSSSPSISAENCTSPRTVDLHQPRWSLIVS